MILIPRLLKNNPDTTYKLVAILDISCYYPHRYKVVFKSLDDDSFQDEYLLPEQLRNNYIVGNNYKYDKEVLIDQKDQTISFNKIDTFRSIKISSAFYKLQDYDIGEYAPSFGNQLCFKFIDNDIEYIIPKYVIANRYYFLSTNVKKALSRGMLEPICYDGTYKHNGETVELTVKHTLAKKHIPYIAEILSSQNTKDRFFDFFRYINDELIRNNYELNTSIPIDLSFPFDSIKSLNIKCIPVYTKTYDSSTKENKKIFLVTQIANETISYSFNKLHYKIKKRRREDREYVSYQRFPQDVSERGLEEVDTNPSSRIQSLKDYDSEFEDLNLNGIEVVEEIEYMNSVPQSYDVYTNEFVYNSHEEPTSFSKDNKVREILYEDSCSYDGFKLEDFRRLFDKLVEVGNIDEYDISNSIELENQFDSQDKKFYLDESQQFSRKLIYGYFKYKKKTINFIEVEHNDYWQKGTWFFVTKEIYNLSRVQNILNDYISHKPLKEFSSDKCQVFYTHHDGLDINNEDYIEDWCKNRVLKRI